MSTPADILGIIDLIGKKLVAQVIFPTGLVAAAGTTLTGGTVSGTTTIATNATSFHVGLSETVTGSGEYEGLATLTGTLLPDTTTQPYTRRVLEVASGTDMTSYAAITSAYATAFALAGSVMNTREAMPYGGGFLVGGAWGKAVSVSGTVNANLVEILGTAPTATAGVLDVNTTTWGGVTVLLAGGLPVTYVEELSGAAVGQIPGSSITNGAILAPNQIVIATYAPPVTGQVPASSQAAFTNTEFGITINYPATQPFIATNFDATGWTEVVFLAKTKSTDADSAAIIAVRLSNPGGGSDGLYLLNGTTLPGGTTASDGALSIPVIVTASNAGAASTTVTLTLAARGAAVLANLYYWELAFWNGAVKKTYLGTGQLRANQSAVASAAPL